LYRVSLYLRPGHYLLHVQSGVCSRTFPISVLRSMPRTLSITTDPQNVVDFTSRRAIAGVLPIPASNVWLLTDRGGKRALNLDNQAFYGENIPPLKYTLRIEIEDLRADITVDMTASKDGTIFIPSIGYGTIRDHLGYAIANGKTEVPPFWREKQR